VGSGQLRPKMRFRMISVAIAKIVAQESRSGNGVHEPSGWPEISHRPHPSKKNIAATTTRAMGPSFQPGPERRVAQIPFEKKRERPIDMSHAQSDSGRRECNRDQPDSDCISTAHCNTQPDRNVQNHAIVSPIMMTVVAHATQLNRREFT